MTYRERANALYDALMNFDNIIDLVADLGCTLDYWASENGVSAMALEDALERLAVVSKWAHSGMGLPTEKWVRGSASK